MMRLHPSRAASQKGFTLVEVATVAAISAIVFLVLIRWLSTLSAVSGSIANSSTPARNAAYVQYRLASDIAMATVCYAGSATPLRTVNAHTLELYVSGSDAQGRPNVSLVRWQASKGIMTRSSWTIAQGDSGNCLPPAGSSNDAAVMASGVYTGSQVRFFTPVVDGKLIDADCETGPDGMPTQPAPDGVCYTKALQLRATFLGGGQDTTNSANWTDAAAPARVDHVYSLPGTTGGAQ